MPYLISFKGIDFGLMLQPATRGKTYEVYGTSKQSFIRYFNVFMAYSKAGGCPIVQPKRCSPIAGQPGAGEFKLIAVSWKKRHSVSFIKSLSCVGGGTWKVLKGNEVTFFFRHSWHQRSGVSLHTSIPSNILTSRFHLFTRDRKSGLHLTPGETTYFKQPPAP